MAYTGTVTCELQFTGWDNTNMCPHLTDWTFEGLTLEHLSDNNSLYVRFYNIDSGGTKLVYLTIFKEGQAGQELTYNPITSYVDNVPVTIQILEYNNSGLSGSVVWDGRSGIDGWENQRWMQLFFSPLPRK